MPGTSILSAMQGPASGQGTVGSTRPHQNEGWFHPHGTTLVGWFLVANRGAYKGWRQCTFTVSLTKPKGWFHGSTVPGESYRNGWHHFPWNPVGSPAFTLPSLRSLIGLRPPHYRGSPLAHASYLYSLFLSEVRPSCTAIDTIASCLFKGYAPHFMGPPCSRIITESLF